MTDKEALAIKGMIESAFPFAKQTDMGDAIYISVLADYQFIGIKNSLDNLIRTGQKYTPTLGELIQGYEVTLSPEQEMVFDLMDANGEFMDERRKTNNTEITLSKISETNNKEVSEWNYNNRRTKAKMWITTNRMPDWFSKKYNAYKSMQISYDNRLQIEEAIQ